MTSKQKGASKNTTSAATSGRQSTFFISGDGIDREVITTDICRYLGNDALVKPGVHQDSKTGRTTDGFYITAYRPPTSAQLADLRADSQKWREERARTARSPGGYEQSSTQEQSRIRENPQLQREPYNTPTSYGQMNPSMPAQMGVRTTGYEARVGFPTSASMAPPAAAYPRNPVSQYTEQQNYTFTQQPNQQGNYIPMDSSRDRMDINPGQPWNMPQGASGYPTSGTPQVSTGYNAGGRTTYSYPQGSSNQAVPSGYGRGEPPSNYDFGARVDSGIPTPDPQEAYYPDNDNESMEIYEEPTTQGQITNQGQVPNPPRRERDRDSRERHEEPRQKHRSHR